jgi:hypothetical protein
LGAPRHALEGGADRGGCGPGTLNMPESMGSPRLRQQGHAAYSALKEHLRRLAPRSSRSMAAALRDGTSTVRPN